ncbi:MAG: selenide, water dikinase SelD [Castellaniella sp.]|uniref:selenide, water dikinase SelD n=1 Tax=Castellaniella sp. TaxID=1955812 RepID=UPI0012044A09|nr:selenide, water dikinase SelD [Castellaniella sp.]TAN26055.1 MAG: selenide, water dikinase SelD [Castellaniella sp.]
MTQATPPRLTSLSHGGGCGCKIAPDVLAQLMRNALPTGPFPDLLVGTQTADDAAVYRLNDEQALIATTDFFMPIVDDPQDFGRIAAANALSDVYAMGGKPIMALALVGMPIKTLPTETINAILAGGASICQHAGIPIAGGHSIDSVEPIYGLAVMGIAHPGQIRRNDQARAGDVLILSKPLGVGILSAALKKGLLDPAGYQAMIASTTQLNTPGARLGQLKSVHAMTDVTGFSLLGHTLEMCRGSGLRADIEFKALPWLPGVRQLAEAGTFTGASARNWRACESEVTLDATLPSVGQTLLTDPQTSGGLLVACSPEAADSVLELLRADGFGQAGRIGTLQAGAPHIRVS